jgi:putative copper export protein
MAPDYAVAVVRALAMLCTVLAVGLGLWRVLVADEPGAHAAHAADSADDRVRSTGRNAGIAAVVLVTADLLLQPARMLGSFAGGMDRELLGFALEGGPGAATATRLIGLMFVVAALMLNRGGAGRTVIAVAGALLVAVSWPLAGHTATSDLRWLLGPSLGAHVLIVMFWAGGVAGLWFNSRAVDPQRLALRTAAFSRLATVPVPVIGLLGVIIAWGLVPEWRALLSGYGVLLLAKVSGFALLLVLASVNRWSLTPRLAAGDRAAIRKLRWSLVAEGILLALVLVLTTLMTLFYSPYQVVR